MGILVVAGGLRATRRRSASRGGVFGPHVGVPLVVGGGRFPGPTWASRQLRGAGLLLVALLRLLTRLASLVAEHRL